MVCSAWTSNFRILTLKTVSYPVIIQEAGMANLILFRVETHPTSAVNFAKRIQLFVLN